MLNVWIEKFMTYYIKGSQPLGQVPVPGLEEGPSGTRKVAKLVYLLQF